jgi:hypothetical protein
VTTAEELDALPIRERDAWVAAVLRFMRERGYTVTAPGQELAAAGLLVDLLATVKAEAWDEGWRAGRQRMVGGQIKPNPYRPGHYAGLAQAERIARGATP